MEAILSLILTVVCIAASQRRIGAAAVLDWTFDFWRGHGSRAVEVEGQKLVRSAKLTS